VIFGAVPPRIYIATRPIDFRKGMDGLAAAIQEVLKLDPFCGAAFIFRSKRADRIKILIWDGSGLILIYKRLHDAKFRWPRIEDGVMRLSPAQLSALFEGLDWGRCERCGNRRRKRCNRPDLADWVGKAAALLAPLQVRLFEVLKASPKLFADETRCPVLDPGRKRVKLGQLWAYARDDRPWGGDDPPAVVYCYAPGRGLEHVQNHLAGFSGILQVDGYSADKDLASNRPPSAPLILSFCWTHLRRRFYEIAVGGNAPLADAALVQIAALYKIEEGIRGQSAEARRKVRQAKSRPLLDQFKSWLDKTLPLVPGGSKMAKAISYALNHWDGSSCSLATGASRWTPIPLSVRSGP
jgi:transposase